jgi:hypothetical protein
MKKLTLILLTLLLGSCVINKSVHIDIVDSSQVEVDTDITGSDVEDINPDLEVPLFP